MKNLPTIRTPAVMTPSIRRLTELFCFPAPLPVSAQVPVHLGIEDFLLAPTIIPAASVKLWKRHKASCSVAWCNNSGMNSEARFFRFPADERCDMWRSYAKRGDLAGLTREQMYNGYRVCSDHFAERAYADPAKTRLLWSAVPSAGVDEGSLNDKGGEGSAASPAAASSLSPAVQLGQPGPVLLSAIDLDDVVAKQVDECIGKEMKALLRPLEAKCSALWAGICQGLRNMERMQSKLSEVILVDLWERYGQEPTTDLVYLSERSARALGPLSKFTASQGPACRKKHRYSYPGTSWRRQLQKAAAKRRQERLSTTHATSAAPEHQKSDPDSHGALKDGYQSNHFEVHSAMLAKCEQNCTEACGLPTRQGKEDSPEERPENRIPRDVELQSGIPYNSESFQDAPYSIGLE